VCVCMCTCAYTCVILYDNLPLTRWYQNLAALLQVITQEKGLSHCHLQSHFHKTSTAGESHQKCETDHSSSDTASISQAWPQDAVKIVSFIWRRTLMRRKLLEDWGSSRDNIKLEDMRWIQLPQDEVQWQLLVSIKMDLQFHKRHGIYWVAKIQSASPGLCSMKLLI